MHDAARNLAVNRLPDDAVRLVAARVEDALPGAGTAAGGPGGARPAAAGLPAARCIDAVFGRIAPPRAIYVSCNPEALAAELPAILGARLPGRRADAGGHVPAHAPHRDRGGVRTRRRIDTSRRRRGRDAPGPAAGCQNEAPPMTDARSPADSPGLHRHRPARGRCGRRLRGADGAPQPLGGVHGRRLRVPRRPGGRRRRGDRRPDAGRGVDGLDQVARCADLSRDDEAAFRDRRDPRAVRGGRIAAGPARRAPGGRARRPRACARCWRRTRRFRSSPPRTACAWRSTR